MLFVDLAGLKDTSGDLIEIVNSFLSKTVFTEAKSVQFILTIPFHSLAHNRGETVRETMKVMQQVCQGQQLYSVTDALRPVITHYPASSEKDIAEIRSEIEDQLIHALEQERELIE